MKGKRIYLKINKKQFNRLCVTSYYLTIYWVRHRNLTHTFSLLFLSYDNDIISFFSFIAFQFYFNDLVLDELDRSSRRHMNKIE